LAAAALDPAPVTRAPGAVADMLRLSGLKRRKIWLQVVVVAEMSMKRARRMTMMSEPKRRRRQQHSY
jgi:hypothetical protein